MTPSVPSKKHSHSCCLTEMHLITLFMEGESLRADEDISLEVRQRLTNHCWLHEDYKVAQRSRMSF